MAPFLKWILMAALFTGQVEAKDLGIYGPTASIGEDDLVEFIVEKIQKISQEDRQAFIQTLQSCLINQIKQPMEVKGIGNASIYSVHYFDPSIVVDRDILNYEHQTIIKKGSHFNPLSRVSLKDDLIFFDATNPEHLAWAESQFSSATWILIKGQPMQLEETLNRPIYFDQGGVLSKKFGIHQVPARVSQEGLKLKIEFIPVQGDSCATS